MGILDKVLMGRDEKILKENIKIIEIAIKANRLLIGTINSYKNGNEIRDLEKKSDREEFKIANAISSGAIAPNLIDNMIEMLDKEDSIVDSIYNLSREIMRYRPKNNISAYCKKNLLLINGLADEALGYLKKMESEDDIDAISSQRMKIEAIEEAGDEIKDKMFDYAYKRTMDFKEFYHMIELAHKADDILDNCEDAADAFMTIMSSIMR
ncbi:MAG: DUF47 family protein [Candidatus Micrarchaeaceae archaeon]